MTIAVNFYCNPTAAAVMPCHGTAGAGNVAVGQKTDRGPAALLLQLFEENRLGREFSGRMVPVVRCFD